MRHWIRGLVLVLGTCALALYGQRCLAAGVDSMEMGAAASHTAATTETTPVSPCYAMPGSFTELPSVGGSGSTSVNLSVGYDPDTQRLCYLNSALEGPPVIRVGVGQTLSITLTNTLHDTGTSDMLNCPIYSYEGEGNYCLPTTMFAAEPGPDGTYYPIMANQAMAADGTTNLHVHGMFVSPRDCSDNAMATTVYPANWGGDVTETAGCQTSPNTLTYSYVLPKFHPAGLYWYHDHRHGATEMETQMGLAGAIVVEDAGDAWRQSIGVNDEVLLVTDVPKKGCLNGVSCDAMTQTVHRKPLSEAAAAAAASARTASASSGPAALDPRIDQVDQAGCTLGATGPAGGTELWTLRLNGADVPESAPDFPPDSELLTKTMQPGQRLIFRLANATADSFLEPELVLSQNGTQTVEPLEVFARDGVGITDQSGKRILEHVDVATTPLVVPPAGRVEFVVHVPPAGAELYLQSAQFSPGCGGNAYPARRMLLITSSGTPVSPGAPDDSDLLKNTPSLKAYLNTLGTTATVHRTFVFSEYPRSFTYAHTDWTNGTPTTANYDPSLTDFYITETASDDGTFNPSQTALIPFNMSSMKPAVTVHLHGQQSLTEQWLIQNSTLEAHAFHIHQVHFQDITNGTSTTNTFLDTIMVPPAALVGSVATGTPGTPGYVILLMTFTKQDIGEFMFHCHIMEHEDSGMMGLIRVVAN